jgi:murein L,D-transpeptidase YcbB/YkuD
MRIIAILLLTISSNIFAQITTMEGPNRQFLKYLSQQADSVGIPNQPYLQPIDEEDAIKQVSKLLTEIHYGHRPAFLSHQGLSEKIDTTLLHNAVKFWSLMGKWEMPKLPSNDSLLKVYRTQTNADTLRMLAEAMNFNRWLNRFDLERYAVINIPAAELNVHDSSGNVLLNMRVIVGKNSTRTPCMTAPIREVITYPYWNVPRSIAIKEMLPKIKKNVGYLASQRLQVFGANGQEINPVNINWQGLSATNFPYRLRQTTGCDNALGVIKFNLISPFDVYLHDTNQRSLFTRPNRWLSHGCIRLQKPIELANLLFGRARFPDNFLEICLKDQTPRTEKLDAPFPVFIVYQPAALDTTGKVAFYPDVYKFYKK